MSNSAYALTEEEQIPCETCGDKTPYLGTKRCNGCWEIESRLPRYIQSKNGRKFVEKLLLEIKEAGNGS